MTEGEELVIHPEGDVVFVCTDDEGKEVKMRVLSSIVALGSPVFKAMLGPDFKEGNALRTQSQVEIPLPDDDPKVLGVCFRAMHMTFSEDDVLPTSSFMVDLALLHDKYQFATGLRTLYHALLSQVAENNELEEFVNDPAGVGDALVAAAVLGSDKMTATFGHTMLRSFHGKFKCSARGESLLPLLHIDIFAQLEEQRLNLKTSMCDVVEDQLQVVLNYDANGHGCGNSDIAFAAFTKELQAHGIWPISELSKLGTLARIAEIMARASPPGQGECCKSPNHTLAPSFCGVWRSTLAAYHRIQEARQSLPRNVKEIGFSRVNSDRGQSGFFRH